MNKGVPLVFIDGVTHPMRLAIVREKAGEDSAKGNHGGHHANQHNDLNQLPVNLLLHRYSLVSESRLKEKSTGCPVLFPT